jgi:hypothetical protein
VRGRRRGGKNEGEKQWGRGERRKEEGGPVII